MHLECKIKKITLKERKSTFKEVSRGFTKKEAIKEAKRCLQCKVPLCIQGCPVNIDIKSFIFYITQGEFGKALVKIREKNPLPGVCGRVCPQEKLCQSACILSKKNNPIKIGYLERFAYDWGKKETGKKRKKKKSVYKRKVAVIGAGPAGLSCAGILSQAGFKVTLFEALHRVGGVLVYGIPAFRLPKKIIEEEVEYIRSLGVEIVTNFAVGATASIEDLKEEGFEALFISVGAGSPLFLGIPGENFNRVYSANEFLVRINLMHSYLFGKYHTPLDIGKKVGVIGGGDVAFDCARCALRLGAEQVYIIYRRTEEEMPARQEERNNAKEEGIKFKLLTSPKEIIADKEGSVKGLICIKNKLGSPDASGRRKPIPIPGSEFKLSLDTLIIAIGTQANPLLISKIKGLKLNERGYIEVNGRFKTSLSYIFAGGDIVSGSATVISAIRQAKIAAQEIINYLLHK